MLHTIQDFLLRLPPWLWIAIVVHFGALGTVAYLSHVSYGTSIGDILLMIGLMLGVQAEIAWRRAQAMGAFPAPAATVAGAPVNR